MHKIVFYDKFFKCLYMFRALCAHHQKVKIVLYCIWYHQTWRWPSGAHVSSTMCSSSEGQNCSILNLVSSDLKMAVRCTCFEQYVLIIRRWELYYTASGIITPVGGRPVHRLRKDCTPDGHVQVWWYQMLYNTVLTKHVEAFNKLIIKQDFMHKVG